MQDLLIILAILAVVEAFFTVVIRGLVKMHTDRESGGTAVSGLSGVMSEIDRVVRPSIENTEKLRESIKHKDDIGGD